MESVRPHLGDKVYRDMDPSKAVAQYNRDLALYEQAEALEKQNKVLQEMAYQQEQLQEENRRAYLETLDLGPLSEEEHLKLFADVNEFKEGSELSNKFEMILNEYKKYNKIADYFDGQFLLATLMLILSFSWIVGIVNTKTIPYIILVLVINIIALSFVKLIHKSALYKAETIQNKLIEMKVKHKSELTRFEPDEPERRYVRRKISKKKSNNENKEKPVLYLEHNE